MRLAQLESEAAVRQHVKGVVRGLDDGLEVIEALARGNPPYAHAHLAALGEWIPLQNAMRSHSVQESTAMTSATIVIVSIDMKSNNLLQISVWLEAAKARKTG